MTRSTRAQIIRCLLVAAGVAAVSVAGVAGIVSDAAAQEALTPNDAATSKANTTAKEVAKNVPKTSGETTSKSKAKKSGGKVSLCKGLSETACSAKATTCSWVKSTKLKTGKTRKAYCRLKPKAKPKSKPWSQANTTANEVEPKTK